MMQAFCHPTRESAERYLLDHGFADEADYFWKMSKVDD